MKIVEILKRIVGVKKEIKYIEGNCPECGSSDVKVVWAWEGVYCDLTCNECGHFWTVKENK